LIVKHKLSLDDRETIETIRENLYIQFFLGLSEYTYKDIFDRSLFTTLRYRMGMEKFDAMTCELVKRAEIRKPNKNRGRTNQSDTDDSKPESTKENQTTRKTKGNYFLMQR